MPTIKHANSLPSDIEDDMRHDLAAYEASHGIDVNYHPFALILTDDNNVTLGVANGFTCFAEVYVSDLWVHSTHRQKGYGRQLLTALEEHYSGKGFNNINLCTSNFNAPEFYRKCGYTAEFTRINKKHPKLSKTFFVKYFDDEEQTQGILP